MDLDVSDFDEEAEDEIEAEPDIDLKIEPNGSVNGGKGYRRSKNIPNTGRLAKKEISEGVHDLRLPLQVADFDRPKYRGDCVDEPRPCPWVSCTYHLYLDVNKDTGGIKLNFPDIEVWEMRHSCALDIADLGGVTLQSVGDLLNITRERIRQVENETFEKLRDIPAAEDLFLMADDLSKGDEYITVGYSSVSDKSSDTVNKKDAVLVREPITANPVVKVGTEVPAAEATPVKTPVEEPMVPEVTEPINPVNSEQIDHYLKLIPLKNEALRLLLEAFKESQIVRRGEVQNELRKAGYKSDGANLLLRQMRNPYLEIGLVPDSDYWYYAFKAPQLSGLFIECDPGHYGRADMDRWRLFSK